MVFLFHLTQSHSPPLFHLQINSTYTYNTSNANPFSVSFCKSSSTPTTTATATSPNGRPPPTKFTSLVSLKPYLQSDWRPILSGWVCSAVSVYSLSKIVPLVGKFPSLLTTANPMHLRKEGLVLGVLVLVRIIASYLQQAFLWEAALNCVYKIRVYVFNRVLQRDLGFFEGEKGVLPGDIAYRITAEASDVGDTVYSLLDTIVPSTLQFAAMATQMVITSPTFSLISALAIPSMAFITGYLGETLREISNEAHLSIAALSAYLNEVFPSILFVKANNTESCEIVKFQSIASTQLSAYLRKKKMKAFIPHIVQIMYFGLLFAFGVASLVISRGSFNCSAIFSFITSLVLLMQPIQGVGKAYNELKEGEPAIERLLNLTMFKSQVIEKPDAVELGPVTGEVKFCGVSFKYGDDIPFVLDGLNLHIKAGETIALVGPSGGGKTTLAKLLLRLYDPLFGSILIDGIDIRNVRLESLRRHVGLVSQDTVTQTANADEFIKNLPEQFETNVGPRGSNFSGGQKQRLAIARALCQNPTILILDEATSALDSRSELLVRQALQHLMQNRTVLVIAHRLETVLMTERVFLLNDGKLREVSHSSLMDELHGSLSSTELVI
ncbi:ABC transporter B family member 29, chloroplastic isoform X2 [Olea europaea var. sylvestris]|uniref:ABC transporter B family member 29, chloroplastic isoform X2 n=1 Tax=Olea europaea var. sylvestris TaxID=158386 RepID=UPI000C1D5D88|nr:ABC transporter B family member 29, chloroplastic isoform X2 [Olea europaea var. sylvestris]